MLTLDHADQILQRIVSVHRFAREAFTPFHTDQTTGYIPNRHVPIYLDTGLFAYDFATQTLSFADHVNGFEAKSHAMTTVTEQLIESGFITASMEPHFQERAVGGDDRLSNPEFKINRAYFRYYGFMADGVFLNALVQKETPHVLLQVRASRVEHANTYDFAAGGAVKFPQSLNEALNLQALQEMGVTLDTHPAPIARSLIGFSEPDKEWVTQICHHVYSVSLPSVEIGMFDAQEVKGFDLVPVEEAVRACAEGQFNLQNTQSFMAALVADNLLPDFPGADKIRHAVAPYIIAQPMIAPVARFEP